jgi:two-component system KDP operon response regulator KdpE
LARDDTDAHILIVEDDKAVQGTLVRALERTAYTFDAVSSLAAAAAYIAQKQVDLVLLDLRLPDGDGSEFVQPLKARWPDAKVLILTGQSDEIDRVRGFRLGADDYIVKPFSVLELLERIRVRLGSSQSPHAQLVLGSRTIDLQGHRIELENGESLPLTRQEARVLHILLRNRGDAVSRNELLETVWGFSAEEAQSRSLDVVIGNLRRKIEEQPRQPKWLITVYGVGYKLLR